MKKIILDTNFLMVPIQFRVDIFSEIERICNFSYKLYIFDKSIGELKNIIEKQAGKNKKAAQFALKLIKLKNIVIIKSEKENVDALILSNLGKDTIVATQDALLKKKLLEKNASLIILRQKKYLQLAGKAL
ncbi:twitching motility protein PilT [Candidatus Woesearchaeota archaeon]|nr:twitching motility protein PilT [Candidatus Woesearchaeota archaeon]